MTSIFRPAFVVRLALFGFLISNSGPVRAQSSDAALDSLLAPIALYPDALLAQVLTAATSPDQVTEFSKWLKSQQATGSDLQQAAMDANYDAAFASLALFPDVVTTLADNMDWTRELGTAYLSEKDKVAASVQRLRAQAQSQGNLKSGEQQTVKVEGSGSTQTIIIEPANPQVVYVPTYPTTVYTQPAPPPSNDGSAAVGALLGFAAGIAIGAAIDNDYYGWGAWGWGWHGGGGVIYHHTTWVVPVRPRYPYVRPVPGYRPRTNVYAPRRTNVNVNVNNNRINTGDVNIGNKKVNNINSGNRDRDKIEANNRDRPGNNDRGRNTAGTQNRGNIGQNDAARGRAGSNAGASRASNSVASGYSSGSQAKAASSRGRSSAGPSRSAPSRGGARSGGGGRRR